MRLHVLICLGVLSFAPVVLGEGTTTDVQVGTLSGGFTAPPGPSGSPSPAPLTSPTPITSGSISGMTVGGGGPQDPCPGLLTQLQTGPACNAALGNMDYMELCTFLGNPTDIDDSGPCDTAVQSFINQCWNTAFMRTYCFG
jgi:hypothetical protein